MMITELNIYTRFSPKISCDHQRLAKFEIQEITDFDPFWQVSEKLVIVQYRS